MAASSNLTNKLSTLMVYNATDRLTVEETRQLVFQMGVPVKDVDNIREQNSGNMQRVYLVEKWLDMTPDASLDKLVAGLRKINKNSLAADIESRHPPNATVDSVAPLAPVTATPAPVDPLAPVTATPSPIGPLAPVTATPAPVGPLAPVTATPTPVDPLAPVTETPSPIGPLAPVTATPAPVGPLAPVTATPAPVGPLAPVTATPGPVDSLAPVTATPALVSSLAPVTATPDPVGPFAPVTATPAPVGPLAPVTANLAPVGPLAPVTATSAPIGPISPPDNTEETFEQRVAGAKECVERLQEEFFDLKSDTRESLSEKERRDPKFVLKFQDYLLEMPVAKRQVHIRFFSKNAEEILGAKTIRRLFVVLGRYCNYSNYKIIFHVVKRFCQELKERMLTYRDCLISFEKSTTVDVYLCVITASPGGEIMKGFIRMTMKINKPPSECSLYEIRELKESIEEEAALESYAVYIETPGEGSVCVSLCIHEEVGWMVGVVFTAEFRQEHLLTEVTVVHRRGVQDIIIYLVRNQVVS